MAQKRQSSRRLIGVIHLPALAGAPGASGMAAWEALDHAGATAVREAQIFAQAGFDALILENYGDAPFFSDRVPPETLASLAVIAAAVRESVKIPIGLNVLRNDARSALAIASVCGLAFIRVNVLSGVAASDQGWLIGQAAQLVRERSRLGSSVEIWADIHVKHAQTLSSASIEDALRDTASRGGADAVIISGTRTGVPMDLRLAESVAAVAKDCGVPLYAGSGVTAGTPPDWKRVVTGVIVSSNLRKQGKAGAELDRARVRKFVAHWKKGAQKARRS